MEGDMVVKDSKTGRAKTLKPRAKAESVVETMPQQTPAEAIADISLENDCLLGTASAGELVGLSAKTMRQLRCDKAGPRCFKLGTGKQSRVVYRRSDLETWVKSEIAAVVGG